MAELVSGPVRVRVPASSANLGPGFDTLALALDVHDTVSAEVTGPAGTAPEIIVDGEGTGTVPSGPSHLVHRAAQRGFAELGIETPGLRLHCRNAIPHGRGMGSSAAAIVAGLWLSRELVTGGRDGMDDDALFALAADVEGHPDNVAAAVYGGLTIAYGDAGASRAVQLEVPGPLALVLFVPAQRLETTLARGLLPGTVPHADAAHNAGRAALLVAALTGRSDALFDATEDRLHQDYRRPAMPESLALVSALRGDGVPAVVSGAGPTVLAMLPALPEGLLMAAYAPDGWRVLDALVDPHGARSPH